MAKEIAMIINLVDTQIGRMAVKQSVVEDADVETLVMLKTISQGTKLQFINAAQDVDPLKAEGKLETAYYDPDTAREEA